MAPTPPEQWTIRKVLNWSTQYLGERGIESPRLSIEWLLCKVLDFDRVQLYLHFDRPLSLDELAEFKKVLLRRANREPLQYILGKTEFYSLDFIVDENVLIPRPETELLVEKVLDFIGRETQACQILDIGTGSGNIAIALAKNNQHIQLTAIDISAKALEVARKNAELHQVTDRINFLHQNVTEESFVQQQKTKFDVIVSNPPYIAAGDRPNLEPEVVKFEPAEALFSDDETYFYKIIAPLAKKIGKPGGRLICEIGSEMAANVQTIFSQAELSCIEVLPDLAGRDRMICAEI